MSRKIDQAVAEHVMGWPENPSHFPRFSTDIAAAWQVVEKADLFGWWDCLMHRAKGWCFADIYIHDAMEYGPTADTAPMAICLAALKAKGVEVD